LIINDLSVKTPENTGKKPAKQEMNNKLNMSPEHQPIKEKMSFRVTTPPNRKMHAYRKSE
jgi:hypothetical protein